MAEEIQQQGSEFIYQGKLEGHENWVTCIQSGHSQKENEDSPVLISGSRDKSLIIWKLFENSEDGKYGQAYKKLTGHGHFVTDLSISQENGFAVSSSWDQTLRLWDLRQGKTTKKFYGHTQEVFTCSFSPDNRQILSAGADRKIILWNTLAQKKYESETLNHTDWVSCIRYSPQLKSSKGGEAAPFFASVGWDGRLKIWNTNIQVKNTFKAHEANINGVAISPNGKYIATGGKDKKLYIWDSKDLSTPSREFDAGATIFSIAFNPKLQRVAAGTEAGVRIWNIMSTSPKYTQTLIPEIPVVERQQGQIVAKAAKIPMCVSVTWNALGKKLFAGFTDGNISVWHIDQEVVEN